MRECNCAEDAYYEGYDDGLAAKEERHEERSLDPETDLVLALVDIARSFKYGQDSHEAGLAVEKLRAVAEALDSGAGIDIASVLDRTERVLTRLIRQCYTPLA